MFNTIKWFTGFIITVLQCMENSSDCKISTGKVYYADCVGQNLTEGWPKGVDERIEVLNMSKSIGVKWIEERFQIFSRLRELIVRDVFPAGPEYSPEFLLVLPNLQVLDFTQTELSYPALILPTKITHLYLNKASSQSDNGEYHVTTMNLNELNDLKVIDIVGTNMSNFPNLSRIAPLEIIDLRENAMQYLSYHNIVYYCQLKELKMDEYRKSPSYINRCCYLRMWLDEHEIASGLKCGKNCSNEKYSRFHPLAEVIHDECYARVDLQFSDIFQAIFNILLTIAAFILIVYFLGLLYLSKFTLKSRIPESVDAEFEEQEEEPYVDDETIENMT